MQEDLNRLCENSETNRPESRNSHFIRRTTKSFFKPIVRPYTPVKRKKRSVSANPSVVQRIVDFYVEHNPFSPSKNKKFYHSADGINNFDSQSVRLSRRQEREGRNSVSDPVISEIAEGIRDIHIREPNIRERESQSKVAGAEAVVTQPIISFPNDLPFTFNKEINSEPHYYEPNDPTTNRNSQSSFPEQPPISNQLTSISNGVTVTVPTVIEVSDSPFSEINTHPVIELSSDDSRGFTDNPRQRDIIVVDLAETNTPDRVVLPPSTTRNARSDLRSLSPIGKEQLATYLSDNQSHQKTLPHASTPAISKRRTRSSEFFVRFRNPISESKTFEKGKSPKEFRSTDNLSKTSSRSIAEFLGSLFQTARSFTNLSVESKKQKNPSKSIIKNKSSKIPTIDSGSNLKVPNQSNSHKNLDTKPQLPNQSYESLGARPKDRNQFAENLGAIPKTSINPRRLQTDFDKINIFDESTVELNPFVESSEQRKQETIETNPFRQRPSDLNINPLNRQSTTPQSPTVHITNTTTIPLSPDSPVKKPVNSPNFIQKIPTRPIDQPPPIPDQRPQSLPQQIFQRPQDVNQKPIERPQSPRTLPQNTNQIPTENQRILENRNQNNNNQPTNPEMAYIDMNAMQANQTATTLLMVLPTYCGGPISRFDQWIRRFDAIVEMSRWNDEEKIRMLMTKMHDQPYQVTYNYITNYPRATYQNVKDFLLQRYHGEETPEFFQNELNHCERQPTEKVIDFALRLKILYNRAFPPPENMTPQVQHERNEHLKAKFMENLEPEIRRYLRRRNYRNLEELINDANRETLLMEQEKRNERKHEYVAAVNYEHFDKIATSTANLTVNAIESLKTLNENKNDKAEKHEHYKNNARPTTVIRANPQYQQQVARPNKKPSGNAQNQYNHSYRPQNNFNQSSNHRARQFVNTNAHFHSNNSYSHKNREPRYCSKCSKCNNG